MSSQQFASEFALTWHAVDQMDARPLSIDAISHALTFGRHVWTRGARVFAIGRREVEQYRAMGVNLKPYEGAQVVTATDVTILTVYRNRDLRGLRHKNDNDRSTARGPPGARRTLSRHERRALQLFPIGKACLSGLVVVARLPGR